MIISTPYGPKRCNYSFLVCVSDTIIGVLAHGWGHTLSTIIYREYVMKKANMVRIGLCVLLASSSIVFVGCTKREKSTALGAVIGGGLGLGVGAAVGGGTGAAIGGVTGATAGGLIGNAAGREKRSKRR